MKNKKNPHSNSETDILAAYVSDCVPPDSFRKEPINLNEICPETAQYSM